MRVEKMNVRRGDMRAVMRGHSDDILDHAIKGLAIDGTSTHGPIDVTDEVLAVAPEVLSGLCLCESKGS